MMVRRLIQSAAVLGLATLMAACSSAKPGGGPVSKLFNQCTWDRESCMHEGRYEAGESEYAEREARDLNRQSAARLRRSGL
ncbi:hypothetical protein [Alcaligenes faecalis]|uniref:Lipoprotein n=1 Tax=Alcaligenes faecalis TaxID=511 RepID=A0A2U2BGY0_ALCFA|nr:hypothetical protein [Alcaligenes faecalis]MBY6311073.1 hypothetical protein [Alcaligenes faecalis]MBY6315745.1 hypothetical protein [Alcaligenes faecalis]MBY6391048.1 hypothetical protein [Alcaligenes faecalis]OSZ46259.1 hypothetical protein BVZ30_04750 [Alcaligenes faecalis]OSZ49957.1 hypothetical protein BVZ31_10365 [Alcaligenes faecalis]